MEGDASPLEQAACGFVRCVGSGWLDDYEDGDVKDAWAGLIAEIEGPPPEPPLRLG